LGGGGVAEIKDQDRKPRIHLAMHDQMCRNTYRGGIKSRRKAVIWPEWSMTAEHCCSYGNSNDGTATKYTWQKLAIYVNKCSIRNPRRQLTT